MVQTPTQPAKMAHGLTVLTGPHTTAQAQSQANKKSLLNGPRPKSTHRWSLD
jgi:hypothetical protein